jgi:siderophore synthetase component
MRAAAAGAHRAPQVPLPDASTAAAHRARHVALEVLLRCWLRETGQPVVAAGAHRIDLPACGTAVVVEVARRSPTGAHAVAGCTTLDGRSLDVEELAALVTREAAALVGVGADRAADARHRITESARRAAGYAADATRRPSDPEAGETPGRWLAAEQDLVAGHPWHPMTKSHGDLSDEEDRRYAPEARGRFRLHWFAASPQVLAHDSTGADVPALLRRLAGALPLPTGTVPVPAHPWQAAHLRGRPEVRRLLADGALCDLGPAGPCWWATSSLRTVARPDTEVMLKLSLGLRVTNSRRENLRSELALAVRTAGLVEAGLGAALTAAHPGFRILRDHAWVGVDGAEGPVGLDTVVREQPFSPQDDVWCAGALVDARPDVGEPVAARRIRALAVRRGLPLHEVADLWFRRWLSAVADPLLWLHGSFGIGLEAHLQNVLVGLDEDGLPVRGWYRDNQGWYAAASAVPRLERLVPGVGSGVPLVYDDDLVTERLVYYLAVNHLFGITAALAGAGVADEEHLLRVLAQHLADHARGPAPSRVAETLLTAPTLPVKANLLTGVDGRDELSGSVEGQSVYVPVPNPLREVLR